MSQKKPKLLYKNPQQPNIVPIALTNIPNDETAKYVQSQHIILIFLRPFLFDLLQCMEVGDAGMGAWQNENVNVIKGVCVWNGEDIMEVFLVEGEGGEIYCLS